MAQLAYHRIVRGSVRKGVPRRTLDAKDRADLAWTNLIDVLESTLSPHIQVRWTPSRTHLHFIAMHAHQLGNLDSFSGAPMVNKLALLQATLIHAHVSELTKSSLLELECQSNQGRRCRWNKLHRWRARTRRLCRIVREDLTLCRIREVRTNAIEERLHCGVLYGRAKKHWREFE